MTGSTITNNTTKTLNLSGVAQSGDAINNLGDSSISSDALANTQLTRQFVVALGECLRIVFDRSVKNQVAVTKIKSLPPT